MRDTWKDLTCPSCRGTGTFNERKSIKCLECGGTGRVSLEDKDDR